LREGDRGINVLIISGWKKKSGVHMEKGESEKRRVAVEGEGELVGRAAENREYL